MKHTQRLRYLSLGALAAVLCGRWERAAVESPIFFRAPGMNEPAGAKQLIKSKKIGADFLKGDIQPLRSRSNQTHVIIDGMSVIDYFWKANTTMTEYAEEVRHNIFTLWPVRLFNAARMLRQKYGDSPRKQSPWSPVILVFDLPAVRRSSLVQVKRWRNLAKQGPRQMAGITLAFSQTYVDTSARNRYDADREILYMLEYLQRTSSDSAVIVTENRWLAKQAARCGAEVRGGRWFEQEVMDIDNTDATGTIDALYGRTDGVSEALRHVSHAGLRKAFLAS